MRPCAIVQLRETTGDCHCRIDGNNLHTARAQILNNGKARIRQTFIRQTEFVVDGVVVRITSDGTADNNLFAADSVFLTLLAVGEVRLDPSFNRPLAQVILSDDIADFRNGDDVRTIQFQSFVDPVRAACGIQRAVTLRVFLIVADAVIIRIDIVRERAEILLGQVIEAIAVFVMLAVVHQFGAIDLGERVCIGKIFCPVGQTIAVGILVIAPRLDAVVLFKPEVAEIRAVCFLGMAVIGIFLERSGTTNVIDGRTAVGLAVVEPLHMAEIVVRRTAVHTDLGIEVIVVIMGGTGGIGGMMVVRADDDAVAAFDHRALEISADGRIARDGAASIISQTAQCRLSVQLRVHARGDILTGLATGGGRIADAFAVDEYPDFIQVAIVGTSTNSIAKLAVEVHRFDIADIIEEQIAEIQETGTRSSAMGCSIADDATRQRIDKIAAFGGICHRDRCQDAEIIKIEIIVAADIVRPVELLPAVGDRVIIGIAATVHVDGALCDIAVFVEFASLVIAVFIGPAGKHTILCVNSFGRMHPAIGHFRSRNIGEVLNGLAAIVETIIDGRRIFKIQCQGTGICGNNRQSLAHPFLDLTGETQTDFAVLRINPDTDIVNVTGQIRTIVFIENGRCEAFNRATVDQRGGDTVLGPHERAIQVEGQATLSGVPNGRVVDPHVRTDGTAVFGADFQKVRRFAIFHPGGRHGGASVWFAFL